MSTLKALEILGLPESFARFEGRITTLTTRPHRIIENYDTSSGSLKIYYTLEKLPEVTSLFGLYPFNYLANSIYHMGFNIESEGPEGAVLMNPGKWVTHPAISGLAGQNVYYVTQKINVTETGIDFSFEPYETVVNGIAEDMKNPLIRIPYHARTIVKGTDGKPKIMWTSRYPVTPKKRFRRDDFVKTFNVTMDAHINNTRQTWNIEKCDNSKFITSIGMDIETNPFNSDLKSVVYINGVDASTFNYKTLVNSFGKTYDGFMWQWRLMNGPRVGTFTTDNVYGSTLNIPITGANSTIQVESGSANAYNDATRTLTYNPNLTEEATVIAYMEFLPAGGKNENCGRQLNLETGIERLF